MQEKERPLLRSVQGQALLSLNQQHYDEYLDDASESKLRMDDFMYMRMKQSLDGSSPECTAGCVAHCGRLAELPRTESSQLVGCFEETCGCSSSAWSPIKSGQEGAEDPEEEEFQLMKTYFDMIHNRERVQYLMLQQKLVDYIVTQDENHSSFLSVDDTPATIKKKLNT